MKLHLGCGGKYLNGYINIDIDIPGHYLAEDRPDLVKQNRVTLETYYDPKITREDIQNYQIPKQEVVADMFADILSLDLPLHFADNSLEEIRMMQVFEHLSYKEGEKLLLIFYKLLKPGGKVHLDIPDLQQTAKRFVNAKTKKDKDWFRRLLYGSQRNPFGFHKAMYTKESIKELLENCDFTNISYTPNIHFYPAFGVEGTK
jgi:SAM-dependent methyltransferase